MTQQPRKVFVFALPRSGSTLLCDLLTVPGKSVVLHEPMLLRKFGDGREKRIVKTLGQLGIRVDDSPEHFVRGTIARSWYDSEVLPKLQDYDSWGLKEVYLEDAEQLIEEYQPDQIVLLWRDPKDVALSFLELMNQSLMSYSDRKTLKDEAWAMDCLYKSAEVLNRIAWEKPNHRITYEQLIQSASHRQSLLDYVQLPEFGSDRYAMVRDDFAVRDAEIERHHDSWSDTSVGRWDKEPPGWRRTFAKLCHVRMNQFAEDAGYAMQEGPSIWSHYESLASARRHARKRVSKLLPINGKVLDVGGTTAALAFLSKADVTVVDDGASGKRLISKPWREGVFPSLEAFSTVTFLNSLEYVDDPLRMISRLLQRGLKVIVTYHCSDEVTADDRNLLEFTSHLSRADWAQFASSTNAEFSFEWTFDGYQSLICLAPRK